MQGSLHARHVDARCTAPRTIEFSSNLERGRISDSGTHQELLGRCDFYRRLYDIQFEGLRESA